MTLNWRVFRLRRYDQTYNSHSSENKEAFGGDAGRVYDIKKKWQIYKKNRAANRELKNLPNKDLKLALPLINPPLIPSICHRGPHVSAISSEKQTKWRERRKHQRKHRLFAVWTLFRLCCWFSTGDRVQPTPPPGRSQQVSCAGTKPNVREQNMLTARKRLMCAYFGWSTCDLGEMVRSEKPTVSSVTAAV